ncbi:MAG: nucleoside monophosphate kinase, partial [Peptococcaceae bacterium]|nr:nucleoside monophosphate kinase [Peptococcaceae bacterium]
TYHIANKAPKVEGVCDKCGGELYQRGDDTIETVSNRLDVYAAQTAPLIDYYKSKGIMSSIDGSKSMEEVLADIRTALEK